MKFKGQEYSQNTYQAMLYGERLELVDLAGMQPATLPTGIKTCFQSYNELHFYQYWPADFISSMLS